MAGAEINRKPASRTAAVALPLRIKKPAVKQTMAARNPQIMRAAAISEFKSSAYMASISVFWGL